MNKFFLTILLLYLSFSQQTVAQSQKADSLISVFESNAKDSERLEAIKALLSILDKTDSVQTNTYIKKGKALAIKLKNDEAVLLMDLHQAELFYLTKHYTEAVVLARQVLEDSQKQDFPSNIPDCYELLTKLFFKLGDHKQAVFYTEESINFHRQNEDMESVAKALSTAGKYFSNSLQSEKAIEYYKKSLEIWKTTGNEKYIARLEYDILKEQIVPQHFSEKEINAMRKLIDRFKKNNDLKYLALSTSQMGYNLFVLSEYGHSMEYLLQCIKYSKLSNQPIAEIRSLITLGAIYHEIGDHDKAMFYVNSVIDKSKQTKNTYYESFGHSFLGELYTDMNQHQKALESYQKSLEVSTAGKDSVIICWALLEIGGELVRTNKLQKGLEYLKKAETLYPYTETDYYTETKLNVYLGMCMRKLQLYNDAITYGIKGLQASYKSEMALRRMALKELTNTYESNNQLQKALDSFKKYKSLSDSIISTNKLNQVSLIETEMKIAKQKEDSDSEKEIQKLAFENIMAKEKNIRNVLVASIVVFILILFFIGRLYMIKQRNNKNLTKLYDTIRKQNIQLEKLDESKSRLFTNISHELRTPLTLISSPVETLIHDRQSHNKDTIQKLELIKRNSEQLRGLVDDILDLSKLESNKIELNEVPAQLSPFLNRVFSNFESLAAHLGISYQIQLNEIDNASWVFLDTAKVEKILNNLLSNAIKHTPSGGEVKLTGGIANKKIRLEVEDTGQGIVAADLPHIFDRFFQSKQPDAPVQGGTGIGLALAKELVQLMSGEICVSSEEEKGSRFAVEIPYHKAEASSEISVPETVPLEEISMEHLNLSSVPDSEKQFHVLIAEDHPDMQQFLHDLLALKYHVHLAINGKEAIKILKKTKIDLVVSDVMMPEMDGFSLLEYIKNKEEYRHTAVVMLTALDTTDSKLSALTLGVDDYLTKPFSPEELLARAHNLLLRHEARLEARQEAWLEDQQRNYQLLPDETQPGKLEGVAFYPEDAKEFIIKEEETDIQWLERVAVAMRQELENPDFQLAKLATEFNMSERHFHRKVKQITGMPPKKYQLEVALQKGRYLLERKQYGNVTAICYAVGMSNVSRFSQLYEARFGKKPKEYFGARVS